jgi:outer membrane protein assembly factor BamA/autotransporter translocation and assembly factor TamB
MTVERSFRARSVRWLRYVAGAAVLSLLLGGFAVHLPVVRRHVLTWVVSALARRGLTLDAAILNYNLAALSVAIEHPRLSAATGGPAFFEADSVTLDLSWSIVTGRLHVESLDVRGGRVDVVRFADGSINLPVSGSQGGTQPGLPLPLSVDRLTISDLAVRYRDEGREILAEVPSLTIDLSRSAQGQLAGPLTIGAPATFRRGDQSTTIPTVRGQLALNGATMVVERLTISAPEGTAELSGTYDLVTQAGLRLRAAGDLDVARLSSWVDTRLPVGGALTFSASLDGSDLALETSSTSLNWPGVGLITLQSRVVGSGSTFVVESLHLCGAAGEIPAAGEVVIDESRPSTADLRWRNLDVGAIARAAQRTPWSVGSLGDGTASAEWTGTNWQGAQAQLSTVLRPRSARNAVLPMSGSVDLTLRAGRWTLDARPEVPGAIRARLHAGGTVSDSTSTSTLAGSASLVVTDINAMRHHLTNIGVVSVDSAATAGSAAAHFDLSGTLASPRVVGTIESDNTRLATAAPAMLFARIDATRERAIVDDLRLSIGSNVVTGSGRLGLPENAITGTLAAELTDLASAAFLLPEQWRPQGSAQVSAMLGGTLENLTIDLSARSGGVHVAGQHIRSLDVTGRFSEGIATLQSLNLSQDDGTLTANGQYGLRDRQYAFTMAGQSLVVAPIAGTDGSQGGLAPINGRFDVRLSGQGSIEVPHATGTVDFTSLDWAGYNLGAVRTGATLSGDLLEVQAVVPSAAGRIAGTINHRDRRFSAVVTLDDVELTSLARSSGPGAPDATAHGDATVFPVTGTATVHATAVGRLDDPTGMTIDVEGHLSNTTVNGVSVRFDSPLRVRHEAGEIVAEDVRLSVGDAALVARGRIGHSPRAGDGLRVTLKGPLADVTALARTVDRLERLDASGSVDLDLTATGSLPSPTLTGRLTLASGSLAFGDLPRMDDVQLNATMSGDIVEVDRIGAQWQGATLTGSARLPLAMLGDALPDSLRASFGPAPGPATASLRISALTPAALSSVLDESTLARIGGRVDLEAAFRAAALDMAAIDGEVALSHAEVSLAGVPIKQVTPTRLRVSRGRADVVDWRWEGPSGRLGVGGYVRLTEESPELNLGVAGTLDLRMIGAFVPDAAFSGNGILDARVLGTLADPDLHGQMTVSSAAIAVRDPRVTISDLNGTATLARDGVELRASASANGGSLEAAGSITLSETTTVSGAITLTGRGLAFELIEGLRTEADADLTLAVGERHALTGQVTIVRGAYREPLQLTTQLFSSRSARVPPLAREEPGFLDRVYLNVAVVSAEDIIVDNNYGRLDLGSHIALIGTAAEPAVAGRLAFREGGRVFLGGQTYTVRRGSVDFTNPNRVEPLFDLSLDTRVQNYDITLDLRGTPETFDVSLRSPGLSQEEAVSLLLTGQRTDSNLAYTEIARGQLLMLLSGEVLGAAGRAVGFDAVQVGRGLGSAASTFDLLATESDPEARLTLTKRLRSDVDLIVSQSLKETGDITWIATYQPLARVELRATTDDEQSETYEFRHQVPFGAGVRDKPLGEPSVQPRIASVVVAREDGPTAAEARAQLQLDSGDRFDFYRLQQDRDRLLSWLHERGYLEARVVSRRTDDPDGAITLVHTIAAGPLTTLRIDGYALPSEDVARMRDAWSESVFDGFLVDDLQRIAREALVRQRFARSETTVTIERPIPGEKVAVVSIAPGPRFSERRLVFRGNEAVPTGELEAFVNAQDLGVSAWLDPSGFTSAVEAYYRTRGRLAASVRIEEPAFEGDIAVLPVHIDEGGAFHIGTISVEGTAQRSDAEIRSVFGLEAGAPYDPLTIEPARRRVEGSYLESGYSQARATTTVEADRQANAVDVTLTIREGPREVLADVAVDGANVTTRGTIEHALNLTPNEPLNMGAVYDAQKRLYDTGVFRTVDIRVTPLDAAADQEAAEQLVPVQPVRASVTLQELPRYQFRYGFRIIDLANPEEGARSVQPGLMADLLNRNVFGRAVTAGVAGQIEPDRFLGRGILSLPTLFGEPIVTNLFLTRSRQDFSPGSDIAFREDATEIAAEQRFRPARSMLVTYGYSYGRTHTFDPTPDLTSPLPPLDFRTNVARLSGTYSWDTRNDPSNAIRGWLHSSGLEYGPEVLGSDLRFLRYLGQQYYFRTMRERFSLASAVRVGAGRGFDQDLIPSEKFYAGGGTTVRGFAEQSLGPKNFFGDAIGGNGLLLLNQEFRYRVHRWASMVSFLDAGNVFPNAGDLSFGDLEAGGGFGLRILSPFAILRLDVGFPLTSRHDQPLARWYFGIGQTY